MINRYSNRRIYKNSREMYEKTFEERNVKFINQYNTPKDSTEQNFDSIQTIQHVWSTGDRFYKLAADYYGDPKDWWIIAKFNNTPTESHIKLGDVIQIPFPLQEVIKLVR